MKKFLNTYDEDCIGCHACETICARTYFKVDNPERSRIRIEEREKSAHIVTCNQCETCVQVCPTLALTVNAQGVVLLNNRLCVGCYMCIATCPNESMFRYLGGIIPIKCIACGLCLDSCPTEAIRIEEKQENQ